MVIGLLAAVGGLSVVWTLYWVSQTFSLFSLGHLASLLGLFVLAVLAIPLSFGLGCLYLARRLQQGDRVARVLAVVLCVSAAAAFLLADERDVVLVVIALGCLGVAGVLSFDPTTRGHFTGPHAGSAVEPSPVVAARVIIVIVGCCLFLVGVMFLPLAQLDGSLVIYGLIEIGIAVALFWLSRRLSRGDPSARVLFTLLAAPYLVVALVAGHGEPGVILPVALALGTVGLLWLPRSSRSYFACLPRPTQPALAGIERALDAMLDGVAASRGVSPSVAEGSVQPQPEPAPAEWVPPADVMLAGQDEEGSEATEGMDVTDLDVENQAEDADAWSDETAADEPYPAAPPWEPAGQTALFEHREDPEPEEAMPTLTTKRVPRPVAGSEPYPAQLGGRGGPWVEDLMGDGREPRVSPLPGLVALAASIVLALDLVLLPIFRTGGTTLVWTEGFARTAYEGFQLAGQVHQYPAALWWDAAAVAGGALALFAAMAAAITRGRGAGWFVAVGGVVSAVAGVVTPHLDIPGAELGFGAWGAALAGAVVVLAGLGVIAGQFPSGRPLTVIAAVGVVALLIATAPVLSRSNNSETPIVASGTTDATSSNYSPDTDPAYEPSTTEPSTTVPQVQAGDLDDVYTFTESEDGGYSFTGTLSLGSPTHLTPGLSEGNLTAGSECTVNDQTDVVVPGTLVLTNSTTGFNAAPAVDFSWQSGAISGIEVNYASGPTCNDNDSFGFESTDSLNPGESVSTDLFVVLANYYTPNNPQGDPSVLAQAQLVINGSTDTDNNQVTPETVSGPGASSDQGLDIPVGGAGDDVDNTTTTDDGYQGD